MNRFELLWDGYQAGTLTAAEVHEWLSLLDAEEPAFARTIDQLLTEGRPGLSQPGDGDLVYARIQQRLHAEQPAAFPAAPVHRVHFLKTTWFRYAAMLLLIAGTATYLYQINRSQKDIVTKQPTTTITPSILPGGNKAILTLSDGSTIVLDSAADGALASQGGTRILKLDAGKLAYEGKAAGSAVGFNTISTPRGGQYQISLPDGSNAWLNAGSSITFPTAFNRERNVTMTGEVYFEIHADAKRPFLVTANGETIQVLGTRFNVNAYTNEPSVKTTLVDGSVQVGSTLLQPGQAYANNRVTKANLAQELAWKNGLFNFEGMDVAGVMRQIERWYDVQVVYEKGIPATVFAGKIKRSLALNDLLQILTEFGVKSRMDTHTRTITILP